MAGRFFEPTEEECERMAAETTNASRADLSAHTKLDKSHSGPVLVPRFDPELPNSSSKVGRHLFQDLRLVWQQKFPPP